MAKRRFGTLILLVALCLGLLPLRAKADNIDTQRSCRLSVTYRYDTTAFSGQTVKLYKIADVSADFRYTLTEAFAATHLQPNGIQTNREWDVFRSTLESYILFQRTEPTMTVTTDDSGCASFSDLTPGLYLTSAVEIAQEALTCVFQSALVALPGLTSGVWDYDISVAAKPDILPPIDPDGETEFQVVKLWKGDEGKSTRPQSVQVEIFRDTISHRIVTLSAENNWSYRWISEEGVDWKVVERNVPAGYVMTVAQQETTFLITNTLPDRPGPQPPKTGDSTPILLYTVLLFVSGTMLIILGIAGRRKGKGDDHEA